VHPLFVEINSTGDRRFQPVAQFLFSQVQNRTFIFPFHGLQHNPGPKTAVFHWVNFLLTDANGYGTCLCCCAVLGKTDSTVVLRT